MTKLRSTIFKANYWNYTETDNDLHIYVGGMTQENKSVLFRIDGYTPLIYLQLPNHIVWNSKRTKVLFRYLREKFKPLSPVNYEYQSRYLLHYKEKVQVLALTFPNYKASTKFANSMTKYQHIISGLSNRRCVFEAGDFKVHEHNIDPVLTYTGQLGLPLAGWLQAKEYLPEDEEELSEDDREFSTADIDYFCRFDDIQTVDMGITQVNPKYASFDIECNSKNVNSKLPKPEIPENVVFQIGYVVGRVGMTEYKKYLLTLMSPHPIEDVTMIYCKDEKDLLLKFSKRIREDDPTIFITYNGMKFDWDYLIKRAKLYSIFNQFSKISRIIGEKTPEKIGKWASGAYGVQEFVYMDPTGRLNLDIKIEVERNYKLSKYSLDSVSEFFLKEHKEDITPAQLFMLYRIAELEEKLETTKLTDLQTEAMHIMTFEKCHGVVLDLRRRILYCKTKEKLLKLIKTALYITGVYCVQDCVLPIRLERHLKLFAGMEAMSNTTSVPMSYLHTRGQQIKIVSQIYRRTLNESLIIPHNDKRESDAVNEKFEGAMVVDATPGDHKNVATLDFASLYPSLIIAYNICYTTLIKDEDPISDKKCHILDWESHVGCEHDTQKRKKKKGDVICGHYRYRFRKVVFRPDGTTKYEGVLPRLLRHLLAQRKVYKKKMEFAEAVLKMHRGLATPDNLAFYKKIGYTIIEAGSLTTEEESQTQSEQIVYNAIQLAYKVSANSMYGILGARKGYIPLIAGASSVTAMGRDSIRKVINYILKRYPGATLVYGDTDSCMIKFVGKTLLESYELAEDAEETASHFLKSYMQGISENYTTKCGKRLNKVNIKDLLDEEDLVQKITYDANPMYLEFENMYGRYFLLTKKRYIAYSVNKEGKVIGITKKGVVIARRDNCKFLRDTYGAVSKYILDEKDRKEVEYQLYDSVTKLLTLQVPPKDLILYKGMKSLPDYAKKKKVKAYVERKVGGRKMTEAVDEEFYIDRNGDPFDDPIGPLDPRLVYEKPPPHIMLALKMSRRGDDIPPNSRLEYIFLDTGEVEELQGNKIEDFTYYNEYKRSKRLKIDYVYYFERQLIKPIDEMLTVKYLQKDEKFSKLIKRIDKELKYLASERKFFIVRKWDEKLKNVYDFIKKWSDLENAKHKLEKKGEKSSEDIEDLKVSKEEREVMQLFIEMKFRNARSMRKELRLFDMKSLRRFLMRINSDAKPRQFRTQIKTILESAKLEDGFDILPQKNRKLVRLAEEWTAWWKDDFKLQMLLKDIDEMTKRRLLFEGRRKRPLDKVYSTIIENPQDFNNDIVEVTKSLRARVILDKLYSQFGLSKRKTAKMYKDLGRTYIKDCDIMGKMYDFRLYYRDVVKELNEIFDSV